MYKAVVVVMQKRKLREYCNTTHTTLHYTTHTTLHYTTIHYTHYTALQYDTLHYTTLPYNTIHSITLHTLHYTTLRYTTHYTTLPYTTLPYHTIHCTTLHYTTLPYNTIHYTALHYDRLLYIHVLLHYTLRYTPCFCSSMYNSSVKWCTLKAKLSLSAERGLTLTDFSLRDSAGRLRRGGGSDGRGWCPPGAPPPERQVDVLREEAARETQVELSRKAW